MYIYLGSVYIRLPHCQNSNSRINWKSVVHYYAKGVYVVECNCAKWKVTQLRTKYTDGQISLYKSLFSLFVQ